MKPTKPRRIILTLSGSTDLTAQFLDQIASVELRSGALRAEMKVDHVTVTEVKERRGTK